MSVLLKIAYYQNRRDEVPNQELARELAESNDVEGIREIAENLWNKNKSVRSDCLKVLYQIGYLKPELIEDQVNSFLKLLNDKENRMIWGAMIGLETIASRRADAIWQQIDTVIQAVEKGTLITVVWGIKTLAIVAAAAPAYHGKIFPILIHQLSTCIPRDFPLHAESILPAVDAAHAQEFNKVLEDRKSELTPAQLKRIKKIEKQLSRLQS